MEDPRKPPAGAGGPAVRVCVAFVALPVRSLPLPASIVQWLRAAERVSGRGVGMMVRLSGVSWTVGLLAFRSLPCPPRSIRQLN
jgi:hypothetical protein